MMIYYIGEYYKYANSRKRFKLMESNGIIFHFECGHWCTDNVFVDLIRIKTGKVVSDELQLEMF